eukprot:TRINITY_DN12314_c0_g1_i5.p2 TRINITY_DN12314_c0_g1~~TRINITY_DN12314_c0_g1_i5.p2  ORF type:complete len:515 (-),score=126.84 TRINITY_DN12314_c0_g1_i5:296-1840(-)
MMTAFAIFLSVFVIGVVCVRYGDEQFGDTSPGLFYVFADKVIHVIDPVTLTIVQNITQDHKESPLENLSGESVQWYDGVYMEDALDDVRYVFINEGDVYEADNYTHSYVTVVDAENHKIVARVEVGPRPVHSYAVYEMNEYWTHPDSEGQFDVIKLGNFSSLHADGVEALVEDANHGKLLVDPDLFPLAYATNTGEQYVYKINIDTNEKVANFSYTGFLADPSQCRGTHAIAYSSINKHIYIECSGGGGILEWDTQSDTLVHQWVNETGALYETPDENFIIAAHKSDSKVFIFEPQGNGLISSKAFEVNVPGNPGSPLFFPKNKTPSGLNDYLAFFPLTRNTNIFNLLAADVLGKDLTDPDYYTQPFDCVYNVTGGFPFKLAVDENGEKISPKCGSCADGVQSRNASLFDPSISGFAWIDFEDVVKSEELVTAAFIEAGAVFQGNPYSYSHECAYGRTYRTGKRGGQFVAVVADLPQPSVYFVDAEATPPKLQGVVSTAPNPQRIVYVPATTDF